MNMQLRASRRRDWLQQQRHANAKNLQKKVCKSFFANFCKLNGLLLIALDVQICIQRDG